MREHRNLAVVQGRYLLALESDRARDGHGVKHSAPDEAQDGYSMASKQVSHFVHRHEMGICFRD
jgi:hypothetical protein